MMNLIKIENFNYWDEIVKSFPNYDVYYLSGYVKAFQLHDDGDPILLYYNSEDLRGICVVMKRDISKTSYFINKIPFDFYFDYVSPYGYGGFLFDGSLCDNNIAKFEKEYDTLLKCENVISAFFRYHPQLQNANYLKSISTVIDLGKTIEMNLISEEEIWKNILPKNRTAIRKSIKNGVTIKHGKDKSLFEKFIEIYNETMEHDKADAYYYFEEQFYESIHTDLYENYEMFYAVYEGEIIAMSIILFANNRMHYHLSGARFEFRPLAPTNLLLYEAALWGNKQGFKSFHLGGGFGSGEDGLFKFKQAFNRYSGLQFSIGKQIILHEMYDKLVEIRKDTDINFDEKSTFFPLYRA